MQKNNISKNVIIYCRESRDDGFENYDRIETQRDILVEFCKKQNLGRIIEIIMDDNKSGTNFDRLAPIKEKIGRKEVDILLCKDASRLGRNILESLAFTEYLTHNNVELIFESERYDEDMFPLIAWFNERRVKDDSAKIRRVLKHKMEEGSIIIKAPYGYIKNGNQLVVDTNTAPIIQEIFNLYTNGSSMNEIANILNSKGYLTPSQHKNQFENLRKTYSWNKQHIGRILKHTIYTGDMPYGMRQKISYKSKKYINKHRDDWIIVKDHHEAIVSKEIFEMAQVKMRKFSMIKPRKSKNNIFSGLIFCGRCNSRMLRIERKGMKPSYVCGKSHLEGKIKDDADKKCGCDTHRISEELLILFIHKYITKLLQDKQFEERLYYEICNYTNGLKSLHKQIKFYENKTLDLQKKASLVYEDKLNGTIPEYLFKEKLEVINKELESYKKSMDNLKIANERNKIGNSIYNVQSIIEEFKSSSITNEIISLIFKKIVIFNPNEVLYEFKEEYHLTDADFIHIEKFGGIMFIQNFIYNIFKL